MANAPKIIERGTDGIALEAATPASQPGDIFPAGVVLSYAGSAAPTNWLICDGSVVSRSTYPGLFAAIGTTYGAGDGSTTFGIPDMRGRTVVGKHTSGTFTTLGGTGGEENHTLSNSEMPSHNHTASSSVVGDHTHVTCSLPIPVVNEPSTYGAFLTQVMAGSSHTFNSFALNAVSTGAAGQHNHGISVDNSGGGVSHNNMHPYMVLNHIIKAS